MSFVVRHKDKKTLQYADIVGFVLVLAFVVLALAVWTGLEPATPA